MKTSELQKAVLSGSLLRVAEYRASKAETISYRDQKTGKPAEFDALRHTVECGPDSFKVDEDTRNMQNFDPEKYQAPFKKGDRVVIHVRRFAVDKGAITCAGHLEALVEG